MARSTDGMGRDERVVFESRTHVKALFWPVIALLAAAIVLGVGIAMMPTSWQPWGPWVLVGLFVVFVWWAAVMPFLRWLTSTYTVTTRRSTVLEFHDVFKRLSDGTIFRATSNGADKQSPKTGTLDMCQVTAERWELTQ